jgi:hypothetical protein
MPITINPVAPNLAEQIKLDTAALLADQLIPLGSADNVQLTLTAIIPLHRAGGLNKIPANGAQPAGLRVLLSAGKSVMAALDFYFNKGSLKFSHALTGQNLPQQIEALNAVVQRYQNQKGAYQLAFVDFAYASHPYVLVWLGKKRALYSYFNQKLMPVRLNQFKILVSHFIKKPLLPKLPPNPTPHESTSI